MWAFDNLFAIKGLCHDTYTYLPLLFFERMGRERGLPNGWGMPE